MGRLIDADALKEKIERTYINGIKLSSVNSVIIKIVSGLISNAPSIDATKIIRCKDCKHYHIETYCLYGEIENLKWCDFLNIRGKFPPDPEPMDYCSYGERTDHE